MRRWRATGAVSLGVLNTGKTDHLGIVRWCGMDATTFFVGVDPRDDPGAKTITDGKSPLALTATHRPSVRWRAASSSSLVRSAP